MKSQTPDEINRAIDFIEREIEQTRTKMNDLCACLRDLKERAHLDKNEIPEDFYIRKLNGQENY